MAKQKLTPRVHGQSVARRPDLDPSRADSPTVDENASAVDKFVADHPKGIEDTPEVLASAPVALGEDGPVEPAVEPQAEPIQAKPTTEEPKPAEPSVETPPAADPAAEPTPAEPTQATAPVEPKPVEPVQPQTRVYDPNEKFALAPDVEWTREQVVAALQDRVQLQPQAEEATKFRQLFAFNSFDEAAAQWKPVLDILRADQGKTAFLEQMLNADPAKLDYLARSSQFWDTLPPEERGTPTPASKVEPAKIDVTQDPRVKEALDYIADQKRRAGDERSKREWKEAFDRYPFLTNDNAARESLLTLARALYNEDFAKGIDDLECRGVAAAVEMNKALYDARLTVMRAEHTPATHATQPAPEVGAILGSPGVAPAAKPTRPKTYKGDPQDAVAAFLRDTSS